HSKRFMRRRSRKAQPCTSGSKHLCQRAMGVASLGASTSASPHREHFAVTMKRRSRWANAASDRPILTARANETKAVAEAAISPPPLVLLLTVVRSSFRFGSGILCMSMTTSGFPSDPFFPEEVMDGLIAGPLEFAERTFEIHG